MTVFTTSRKEGAGAQVDENTRFWSDIIAVSYTHLTLPTN